MNDTPVTVLPKFHYLVENYQTEVNDFLKERFDRMFFEVEPVMIDFASKAETDNAQILFFDSISHIQDLSDQVTQAYFDTLKTGFSAFRRGQSIHYPKPIIEANNTEQIDIVENSDLEIHIAIQSMITRSRNKNHQVLYQIGQRLAVMQQGRKLRDPDIPACPDHIATTFQAVSCRFELEQKLLLILYVLFEKNVLNDIGTLYAEINKILSDAGIYPHLAPVVSLNKSKAQNSEERVPAENESSSQPEAAKNTSRGRTEPLTNEDFSIGEAVFNSILSLLTERRRTDPRFKDHPEYRPDGNLEQLRSKPDLVTAINQLDMPKHFDMGVYESETAATLTPADRSAATIEYLQKRITSEREDIYRELDTNTIPTADLDTIELVGMLFEHILDDQDLASLTKTLICHLHTPYLKVAIIDRDFLTNPEHIARKLLNLVVNAGRRWVDENNVEAGIYHRMSDMIQIIMRDFKDDISLFSRAYDEFLDHLQALEHKTKILEERTKEATRGKDRLEYARLRADEVMHQHCAGVRFHPVLWQFLSVVWENYMTLLLLRDEQAEKHKEWRTVLMVINSVIKINNGYTDPQTREWLKHTWPRLKNSIESGLDFLGNTNPSEYVALQQAVHELQRSTQPEPVEKVVVQPEAELRTNREAVKGMRSEKMRKLLAKAQQTDIGSWFEFDEPDGKLQRVKLSWYSPVTNNHMFIDRFGYKAFILPTEVLVSRLANETARIIEPNRFPFVDQALKKIYGLLRTG
ncbi:DUF1631 family protein [Sedimenticola selenatireducens]|uniref:DUF1631 family protein n=1 Tax=Sedimenticola selenatireducens TaxID=191960 RepID=UPI0004AF35E5|nr:DUF1631 family protein [Sedimenticola selenatireducens]